MSNGNEELNNALLETEALLEQNGESAVPQSAFAAAAVAVPREKRPPRPRHVSRCPVLRPSCSLPCLTLHTVSLGRVPARQ